MRSLILTGKLATYDEYIYPLHRLRELGEVDVATVGKETVYGELKGYGGALVHAGQIVPTMDVPLRNAIDVSNLSSTAKEYVLGRLDIEHDLLVLPGGAKAMEYLRQSRPVLDYIAAFHEAGGVIASICHAAQLLISAKLCKGRMVSGYYSIEDDIVNAGGMYSRDPVVSDRIVSAAHYKDMAQWMKLALDTVAANG